MKNYILIAIIFLFLIVLKFFLKRIDSKIIFKWIGRDERYPYSKKERFLTMSEKRFFAMLSQWFGQEYYIFPQIHLSSLININDSEKKQYSYLNKIDRKSVDFALFNKESMLPVIAIELDDYTHKYPRRKERDLFVDSVFKAARLPIIHVSDIDINETKIKEEIELMINERKLSIPNKS